VDKGVTTVALKVPVLEVVIVLGDVDCVVPSYLILILDDPANPDPDTVSVVPPMPLTGLSTVEGVTVNVD